MGWSDGSNLAENVWRIVAPFIPDEYQKRVANLIVDQFERHDAEFGNGEAPQIVEAAGLYE